MYTRNFVTGDVPNKNYLFFLNILLVYILIPAGTAVSDPLSPARIMYSSRQEIRLQFDADEYRLQTLNGETTIQMVGFHVSPLPGDPALPSKFYDVLIPPDIDRNNINLETDILSSSFIPGTYNIKPVPPVHVIQADSNSEVFDIHENIINGRNMEVYGKKGFHPEQSVQILSFSQMRQWKFLRILFTPVQYNPVQGKLLINQQVTVRITFHRNSPVSADTGLVLQDYAIQKEAEQKFLNYKDAAEWYSNSPKFTKSGKSAVSDYVIITTNAIVAGSGAALTDFIAHKESLGYTVEVVTEDQYGLMTGQPPDGTAEKIREWLKTNYLAKGIKWVLLIGNPDPDNPSDPTDTIGDIPMKMCWPMINKDKYHEAPTDYFYADLSGNWDVDGDEYFGEGFPSGYYDESPDPSIDRDTFSVRWTGKIKIDTAGLHWFLTYTDDGFRIKLDGSWILDNMTPHGFSQDYTSLDLLPGLYDFEIEYFELTDNAVMKLQWRSPSMSNFQTLSGSNLYYWNGVSYVAGGLNGDYFHNEDFTDPALHRVDPLMKFFWCTGDDGGPDLSPDVYVGRIPVYNTDYSVLNSILQKIITYESEPVTPAWRYNLLFAAVNITSTESDYLLGEALKNDFIDPMKFSMYRIYESDFGLTPPPDCPAINPVDRSPTAPCNMLQKLANTSYGLLDWSTHGGQESAMNLLLNTDCAYLDDSKPFFAFQGSCLNGTPENEANLGYSLLKQGAVNTVSASRITIGGCFDPAYDPNPLSYMNCNLSYHYMMRIMHGRTAGESLYITKSNTIGIAGTWHNLFAFNMYGDPSISFYAPGDTPPVPVASYIILIIFVILTSAIFLERIRHL